VLISVYVGGGRTVTVIDGATNSTTTLPTFLLAAGLLLISAVSAWAQTVVATVTVAAASKGVAANPVTNKGESGATRDFLNS